MSKISGPSWENALSDWQPACPQCDSTDNVKIESGPKNSDSGVIALSCSDCGLITIIGSWDD